MVERQKTESQKINQTLDTKSTLEQYKQTKRWLYILFTAMLLFIAMAITAIIAFPNKYAAHLYAGWVSTDGKVLIVGGVLKSDTTRGIIKIRQEGEPDWKILADKSFPPVRSISVDSAGKRALILCDNAVLLSTENLDSFQFHVDTISLGLDIPQRFYDMDIDWNAGRGIITSEKIVLYSESLNSDTVKWGEVYDHVPNKREGRDSTINSYEIKNAASENFLKQNQFNFGLEFLFPSAYGQTTKQTNPNQEPEKGKYQELNQQQKVIPSKEQQDDSLRYQRQNTGLNDDKKTDNKPLNVKQETVKTETKKQTPKRETPKEKSTDSSGIKQNSAIVPASTLIKKNLGFRSIEMNWAKGYGIALDFDSVLWTSNLFGIRWYPSSFILVKHAPEKIRSSAIALFDTTFLLIGKDSAVVGTFENYLSSTFSMKFRSSGIKANGSIAITSISNQNKGVAAGEGSIYIVGNSQFIKKESINKTPNAVFANSRNAIICGMDDLLFISSDNYETWKAAIPPTNQGLSYKGYLIFISSASLAFLLFIILTLLFSRLNSLSRIYIEEADQKKSVNSLIMVSGSPSDKDTLGFSSVVDSIIYLINSPEVKPPVHIAVNGDWGSGKSSIMLQVKKKLEDENEKENEKNVTVWFNIWHFESEKDVLTSFLRTIYEAFDLQGPRFRVGIFLNRTEKFSFLENILFWFSITILIPLGLFTIGQIVYAFIGPETKLPAAFELVFNPFSVKNFLESVVKDESGKLDSGLIAPGIVGVFSLIVFLSKIFGSGIASLQSLLTADKLKLGFAREDIGYKESYKRDFSEIIKAGISKDLKLVIFIDDLDRVSGEKIKELLTAINFISDTASNFVNPEKIGSDKPGVGLPVYFISGMASAIVIKSLDESLKMEGKDSGSHFLEKMYDLIVQVPAIENDKVKNLTER